MMSEAKRTLIAKDLPTEQKATSSGVLPPICIFCSKVRKKTKGREVPLVSCEFDSAENSVKEAARALNDGPMLAKIGDINFHSKEVKYHNECKRDYMNKAKSALSKNDTTESLKEVSEGVLASIFTVRPHCLQCRALY